MIVIAGRLLLLGFVFKPVSWLAGDSRLRQTFSLRIHLVERQSLSPICPSTIISYPRSLEASLSTSASRSIAGPIVLSLDRKKPVTKSFCYLGELNLFVIPVRLATKTYLTTNCVYPPIGYYACITFGPFATFLVLTYHYPHKYNLFTY